MAVACFLLTIGIYLCILLAENAVRYFNVATWLNDLLSVYRGIPLLLAICAPEDSERGVNRVLDLCQTLLIALIFSGMFSPVLLHLGGMEFLVPDPALVNRYIYSLLIFLALLAPLAALAAETRDAQVFHRVLAAFLLINVPIVILSNQVFIHTWGIAPGSPLFILKDLSLLVFVAAIPFFESRTYPATPNRIFVFLSVGTPAFLSLFAILAGMLLAVAAHRPLLGILAGLTSFALFGFRSAYGQLQLLTVQWNLRSANIHLEELSLRDPLTGLYNRRWLSTALEQERKRAQRCGQPLSLLLLDIDYFKLFNDTLGHIAGDSCLQAAAKVWLAQAETSRGALARYGGEEFVAIFANTDLEAARAVADKMAEALAGLNVAHPASPFGRVTASIGVATWRKDAGEITNAQILHAVDVALYEAKRQGRNRVRMVVLPQSGIAPLSPGTATAHD